MDSLIQVLKQWQLETKVCPSFAYLVDQHYRLLWFSPTLPRILPHFQANAQYCYQALWQRSVPCEECALSQKSNPPRVERSVVSREVNGMSQQWEMITIPVSISPSNLVFVRLGLQLQAARHSPLSVPGKTHLFSSIIETSADAIIFLDNDNRILAWNKGAEDLFGYKADEMIGQSILKIVPQELVEIGELYYIQKELESHGFIKKYETQRLRKDGELIYVDLTSTRVLDENGHPVGRSEVIKDISSRKELEFELQRSILELSKLNELNELLYGLHRPEEIFEAILIAITAGEGLRFNRAIILRYNEASNMLEGFIGVGPSTEEEAEEVWEGIKDYYRSLGEVVQLYRERIASKSFRVQQIVKKIRVPVEKKKHLLVRVLESREVYQVQHGRPLSPIAYDMEVNGQNLVDVLGTEDFVLVPLFYKQSNLGVLIADNCVTKREIASEDVESLKVFAHQASLAIENARLYQSLENRIQELQLAHKRLAENQQKLIRTEKLAALGEMAAKVAHEIRNPLVSIGGFANLITRRAGDDKEILRYATIIREQVLNLENILNNILNISRPPQSQKKMVDVHRVIHQVATVMGGAIENRDIRLILHLNCFSGKIYGDEKLLYHALLNLFKNAIESFEDVDRKGTITVETNCTEKEVVIAITDNGKGIDPALHAKVFQPFFSTKSSGTGLGLSIVKQIVESHGGRVELQSAPDQGATFRLIFPNRQKNNQSGEKDNASQMSLSAGEKIYDTNSGR